MPEFPARVFDLASRIRVNAIVLRFRDFSPFDDFFERPLAKWLRGFYIVLRLRLDLSSSRSQLGPLVLHASHATQSKS
jgi:hypothetical protein